MQYMTIFIEWWLEADSRYRENADIFEIVNDFTRYKGLTFRNFDKAYEFLTLVKMVIDSPLKVLEMSLKEEYRNADKT